MKCIGIEKINRKKIPKFFILLFSQDYCKLPRFQARLILCYNMCKNSGNLSNMDKRCIVRVSLVPYIML